MTVHVSAMISALAAAETASSLDGFVRTFSFFVIGFGLLSIVAGGFKGVAAMLNGRPVTDSGGVPLMVSGVLVSGFGVAMPTLFPALMDAISAVGLPVSETPTSTPTTTATATTLPVEQPSADLTWLWVTLGLLGAAVLVVALIAVVWSVVRRMRDARALATAARESRERVVTAWRGVHARHDELLRQYLHAETDWDSLFFTPALTDPSVPATAAMLVAMRAAGTARDLHGDLPRSLTRTEATLPDLADLPYPQAVDAFELAWSAAVRNAKRVGQKGIPAAERKTIKEIRDLLNIAENSAASQVERQLAYRRAQKLIAGLEHVHVPERTLAQLEERQALMIEAASPGAGQP